MKTLPRMTTTDREHEVVDLSTQMRLFLPELLDAVSSGRPVIWDEVSDTAREMCSMAEEMVALAEMKNLVEG